MALRNVAIGIAGIMAGMIGLTTANSSETMELVGYGSDVPLSEAVAHLLPEDYDVKFAEGLDINSTISWSSGDDWMVALQNALAGKKMRAVFGAKSISIAAVPEKASEAGSKPVGESGGNSGSELVKSKPDGKSVKQVVSGGLGGIENTAAPTTAGNSGKPGLQDVKRIQVRRDGFTLIPLKEEVVGTTAGSRTVPQSIPDWLKNDSGSVIIPRHKPAWLQNSEESVPIRRPIPDWLKNDAGSVIIPRHKPAWLQNSEEIVPIRRPIPDWLKNDSGSVIIPRHKPAWLQNSEESVPIRRPIPDRLKNDSGSVIISRPKPAWLQNSEESMPTPKPKPADSDQNDSVNEAAGKIKSNERKYEDVKDKQKSEPGSAVAESQDSVAETVPEIKIAGDRHSGVESGDFSKSSKQVVRKYVAEADSTLRTTLRRWVEKDSWTLIWDSKYDYIIEAEAVFGGDLVTAITAIVLAMNNVRPRITVEFFAGNNVVVVSNNAADIVN